LIWSLVVVVRVGHGSKSEDHPPLSTTSTNRMQDNIQAIKRHNVLKERETSAEIREMIGSAK
jgi:hypothetical protein